MNKNNPYGYKVGYRENGSRLFVRYFMTYTYNQAIYSRRHYCKSPQRTRDTNRPIVDPFWKIKPITKKEYLAGIWDEIPFLWEYPLSLFSLWRVSHSPKPKVNAKKFLVYTQIFYYLQQFFRFSLTFGKHFNSYMVCLF